MARTEKTAHEFIQSAFSPIVAVLCSSKVENAVSKNNLSFTELLEPFTTMDWEGQFREPGGTVCIVKNWKLVIRDVNWKPLPPTEARKQLNNAVLFNYNEKTTTLELDSRKLDVPLSTPWFDAWRETYLEVQFPSDHEYTKHFLSCIIVASTSDDNVMETFNTLNEQFAQLQNVTPPKLPKWFNSSILKSFLLLHDVSSVTSEKADMAFEAMKQSFGAGNCFLLSINSKSTVDPSLPTDYWAPYIKRSSESNVDNMSLSQSNTQLTPLEQPPVFPAAGSEENVMVSPTNNTELLHPLTPQENDVYDNANSLQTHSFSGSVESVNVASKILDYSTEVHGVGLNTADVTAIKKFVQDYASKALLPYVEKQISQLSEAVANRKGVSRSLLSATKRWFGTGKGGNTTANNAVIYSNECPELQLRRLGDLWFMSGQWQRAYDAYHTAKREFHADSAWLCYAGALEMAAISAFMAGDANRKTHGYMEESIVTYLNTCRMVQYAVRASLLSVLCLKSSNLHGEAAKQLIRMTSEDSDLRSAMLLEQAALCFLSGPGAKAMCRKYAFHMVLAGHRFSKAGQKKHAYRCYNQAYEVFGGSGWRLATDHVQFALGRLAGALRRAGAAARWLALPLAPHSAQPPHQQRAFLHEYLLAHQQWRLRSEAALLPALPLPLLQRALTAVLCVGPAPLSSPGRRAASSVCLQADPADRADRADRAWDTLEEMLLLVAQRTAPMIFKPTVDFYTDKTDAHPVVPQGEPIQIAVGIMNPMNITLLMKDVELLWHFIPSGDEPDVSNEPANNETYIASGKTLENNVIYNQKIKSVVLEEACKKMITFTLTPLRVGQLILQGVAYKLVDIGEGGVENSNSVTISGKLSLSSGNNEKRLSINVVPYAPCLQMIFSETGTEAIGGEMRTIDVEFRNVGPVDMKNLYIAVSHPDCMSLVTDEQVDDFQVLYDDKYREPPKDSDERAERARAGRERAERSVRLAAAALPRGGQRRAALLLRAAAAAPRLLAYYEPAAPAAPVAAPARAYRLLRHQFHFNLTEAVQISVTPKRSVRTQSDDEAFENMYLAVEVKNVTEEKDDLSVEVLEVSLLSRQWRLSNLTAARSEGALNARERLHVVFKGRRILETLPEGRVEYSCLKMSKSINVPPYSKFITECKTIVNESVEYSQEKRSTGLIRSMFVVRWRVRDMSKKKDVVGQHALWLDCFSATQSLPKEMSDDSLNLHLDDLESKIDLLNEKTKTKTDEIVLCKLDYSSNVVHDFRERKLCLIPIAINLVNCYSDPVNVFIDMSKKLNRETSELGWIGALNEADNKEVGVSVALNGFESRRVQVSAACAGPGTYLVGAALGLSISHAGLHRAITQLPCNTSMLIVSQAPSD